MIGEEVERRRTLGRRREEEEGRRRGIPVPSPQELCSNFELQRFVKVFNFCSFLCKIILMLNLFIYFIHLLVFIDKQLHQINQRICIIAKSNRLLHSICKLQSMIDHSRPGFDI